MSRFWPLIALISLCFAISCNGYNILGIFPTPAPSHYFVGSSLMKGLAKAGHKVTIISPMPSKGPLENFEEVQITGTFEVLSNKHVNMFDMADQFPLKEISSLYDLGVLITNHTLSDSNVVKLLNSKRHFDVVIVEIFVSEALIALGRHFNAPVIGLSTFGASIWTNSLIGNPSPLSFVPHPFLTFSEKMDFWQRVGNTLMTTFETIAMQSYFRRQEDIFKRHFKDQDYTFQEMLTNDVSLILLNTHFTLGYTRPSLPNMIEVGGMHINREKAVLPTDLQLIMDKAKQGIVYFSMGSNLKSAQLPKEKREALINSFRKLSELVLWKWEDEDLPGKPDNVIIRSWYPQDAVLSHPNVKLFITHGGLLSTSESIYFGKPIIGIPVFGDQMLNMKRAVGAGYGVLIDYSNVTETAMSWALQTVLQSVAFSDNIQTASRRYRDQIRPPLDNAVYWVEYIVRHKGAPHIQSQAKQLNFITYHNLDVFSFLAAIVLMVFALLIRALRKCFRDQDKSAVSKRSKVNKNKLQ